MHWTKAKNIIIIILAALNIFLAVNLYIINSDGLSSKEAEQNARAILSSRNITVNCKVPSVSGVPKRLNFMNDGYETTLLSENLMGMPDAKSTDFDIENSVVNGSRKLQLLPPILFLYTDSKPESTVDTSKIARMEKYAVNFLKDRKLMPKSYVMDNYVKNADNSVTFIFIEKYGGNLIFDNYLETTVGQKGITRVLGSHRSIKKAESVSQDKIMTAWQVILRSFTDNSGTEIESVDFGYKEETSNIDNMKASLEDPVWRIKVKGSKTQNFYNAFIGYKIN